MASIRPAQAPTRMVSSWNLDSSNSENTSDNNVNSDDYSDTRNTSKKKKGVSKAVNKSALNVTESAHNLVGGAHNLVDGAAHAAHHVLGRVLGHHRAEHDELLEKIRSKVIREEHEEVKHSLESFGYFGGNWIDFVLVKYVYSHHAPVGAEVHEHVAMRKFHLVHPKSNFRGNWDAVLILFVFFTAIVLPIEISFKAELFPVSNILVDIVFYLDVLLNLNTSFHDENRKLSTSKSQIAYNYCFGYGFWDLLAAFPFDHAYSLYTLANPNNSEAQTAAELQYFAILKMTRLFRIGRVLKFLENFEFASLWRIIRLLLSFLLVSHWFGCALYFVSETVESDPFESFTFNSGISQRFHQGESFWNSYITVFYSAFLLILGEGLDFHTPELRAYAIFVMFFGAVLNSVLFGQMALLLQNLNRSGNMFQAKLDAVNDFMRHSHLPTDLKDRIHQYIEYKWHASRSIDREKFLKDLSYPLFKEVNLMLHGHLINSVPLFKNIDADCLVMLTCSLKPIVFLPNDFIIREGQLGSQMYFLRNGHCKVTQDGNVDQNGKPTIIAKLHSGDYFGETGVLSSRVLRRANVIAETHCDMYVLTGDSFQQIVRNFPSAGQNIRENLEKKMNSHQDGHVDAIHNMMKRSFNKVKSKIKFGGMLKSKSRSRSVSDITKGLGPQVTLADLDNIFGNTKKSSVGKKTIAAKISTESISTPSSSNHQHRHTSVSPTKATGNIENLIHKLERHIDHKFWQLSTALRIPTRHFNDYGK